MTPSVLMIVFSPTNTLPSQPISQPSIPSPVLQALNVLGQYSSEIRDRLQRYSEGHPFNETLLSGYVDQARIKAYKKLDRADGAREGWTTQRGRIANELLIVSNEAVEVVNRWIREKKPQKKAAECDGFVPTATAEESIGRLLAGKLAG